MSDRHDIKLILHSRTPLLAIESRDEARVIEMLQGVVLTANLDSYLPLFRWTITDGLQRVDIALEPQAINSDPTDVLKHIRAVSKPGIYVLLDFHPFLDDPVHVRLLKDICLRYREVARQIIFVSHEIRIPNELEAFCARLEISLPSEQDRTEIVRKVAADYSNENSGRRVQVDPKAHELLIRNLAGLSHADTERLARNAIFNDGAIARSDLPKVMEAKYELLNRQGVLQYEYETARFSEIGGLSRLKHWLGQRRPAFRGDRDAEHLDAPRGILLLGIQGCGKSLAAKATAGAFGVPLLRLDFGAVYDKYHGETERKLRESLKTADVMSPCVLWIDEIEKGIAGRGGETGTTQRVLGTFLTWMAERNSRVFVVATANDIDSLPPELVRKGRFDEIFFVDLPDADNRRAIIVIHLSNRKQDPTQFDVAKLSAAMEGFSGAEIEQAIVAALYAAHSGKRRLDTALILEEVLRTRPLSVVMHERINALRAWAAGRTVPCD